MSFSCVPIIETRKNAKIWLFQTLTPLFTMRGASDDDAILSFFLENTYFSSVISLLWAPFAPGISEGSV